MDKGEKNMSDNASLGCMNSVKEYLDYIQDADRRIKNKSVEVFQLECLATSITAPTDTEAIKTSGVTDRVGNIVPKIVQVKKEISNMIAEFIDEKAKRIRLIETLENPLEYDVVHLYYVQGMKFTEVAVELGKSYEWILEIHSRAIKNLCEPYINLCKQCDII